MVARTSFLTNLYNFNFASSAEADAKKEREIEEIRKFFENILDRRKFSLSIYEFREIFERYVGLSLEALTSRGGISPAETEIFRITNHSNKKLAEVCLNRRNRKRLSFHQKLARRDFFEILNQFVEKAENRQQLFRAVAKLADLLNDVEARTTIDQLFSESLQTEAPQNVKTTGDETWTTEQHKPLTDNKISANLQVLTATANLSNKD